MSGEPEWERDPSQLVNQSRPAAVSRDLTAGDGAQLGDLALQFAAVTATLLDAATVAEVLELIVQATPRVLPGADVVSVTLRDRDGRFVTPVSTDEVAGQLDELQQHLGEGPYWRAAQDPGPAVAASVDLGADRTWPRFGPAAASLGVRSVVSVALLPTVQRPALPGALNVYSRRAHGLAQGDQHTTLLLATHASLALAHTHAVEMAELKESNLRRGLDSRDVVGQAKGILMARQGISADEAFDILRRTSQMLNIKLVDIAKTLASRHEELPR